MVYYDDFYSEFEKKLPKGEKLDKPGNAFLLNVFYMETVGNKLLRRYEQREETINEWVARDEAKDNQIATARLTEEPSCHHCGKQGLRIIDKSLMHRSENSKYDDLFNPILQALHILGGSGRNDEIEQKIAEILGLSDEEVNEIHRGNRTKLSYRAAWARNYLKRYGLLDNSTRGVWSLTAKGVETKSVDKTIVNQIVKRGVKEAYDFEALEDVPDIDDLEWEEELLDTIRDIEPAAFERLCQRLLRESGFVEVTVEGRTGDGGIDGRGIYKIGGLISIRAIFQAKRYRGSISSQQVREFKGTMTGRAEKGIFITTGTFTRDAKTEAVRDGSTPIDLVDGRALSELLKDLGLGISVKVETTEEVKINKTWFQQI